MHERLREVVALVGECAEDAVALVHEHDETRRRSPQRRSARGGARLTRRRRATGASTCSRSHSSSIKRHQRRWPWSARPDSCSSSRRATVSCRNQPRSCGQSRSCASVAQVGAEPAPERDAEAGLAARRDVRRAARPRTRGAARPCPRGRASSANPAARARARRPRGRGSGERSSSECAIEARSAFSSRSPGRYVATSRQLQARDRRGRWRPSELATQARRSARASAQSSRAQLERKDLHQPRVALARAVSPRRRGSARRGTRVDRGSRRPRAASAARRPPPARAGRGHALRETDRGIALVAGEGLVAAVARERDRHMLVAPARRSEERERSLVAERLVERRARGAAASQRRPDRSRSPRARVP